MAYKDIRNRYRTASLFLESYDWGTDTEKYQPVWTLSDTDRVLDPNHVFYEVYPDHTYPSLRRIYLEYMDPVEFRFATDVIGSDRHWKILQNLKWFQPYLEEWRQALDLKLRSEAVNTIRSIAKDDTSKGQLQAARWLAEKGYSEKEQKGRPSKRDLANKLATEAVASKMLEEDAERIGLK